jgi:hypothetical protein
MFSLTLRLLCLQGERLRYPTDKMLVDAEQKKVPYWN